MVSSDVRVDGIAAIVRVHLFKFIFSTDFSNFNSY